MLFKSLQRILNDFTKTGSLLNKIHLRALLSLKCVPNSLLATTANKSLAGELKSKFSGPRLAFSNNNSKFRYL